MLVLSSLIVGLLFADVGIRVYAPQPMSGTVFEHAPRGYGIIKSNGTALFTWVKAREYITLLPRICEERDKPSAGAERILVLGDSFTFGVGLSEEDTYVARLQRKINSIFGAGRIALLNAGIPGSGRRSTSLFLKTLETILHPARCSCS